MAEAEGEANGNHAPLTSAEIFAELKSILPDVKEEDYKKGSIWQNDVMKLDAELIRRHQRDAGVLPVETKLPRYEPPPRETWTNLGKPVVPGVAIARNLAKVASVATPAPGNVPPAVRVPTPRPPVILKGFDKPKASATDVPTRGVKRPVAVVSLPQGPSQPVKRPNLGVGVARPQSPIVVGAGTPRVAMRPPTPIRPVSSIGSRLPVHTRPPMATRPLVITRQPKAVARPTVVARVAPAVNATAWRPATPRPLAARPRGTVAVPVVIRRP
eukprot:gnl/MRDRNA2_/MRDRNA2_99982_c0_seq1.p1 gnl/MRDRNA2_/MRDRNA2_99982_c0~~gnl/MRDRNA2_/MRDRNA2_99982_c0_seq1.p1  ORF type:complete len:271 (-),score=30.70 gnl/MRDRNA2_/MRDRNA2_99982_c0_seq1:70-882(-)